MDERVVQFRVGVTVLASLIITGILALLFGELPSVLRGSYTVYIKFASAPGVSQDTPVRKSGIRSAASPRWNSRRITKCW